VIEKIFRPTTSFQRAEVLKSRDSERNGFFSLASTSRPKTRFRICCISSAIPPPSMTALAFSLNIHITTSLSSSNWGALRNPPGGPQPVANRYRFPQACEFGWHLRGIQH
jgi:hypothetical protein